MLPRRCLPAAIKSQEEEPGHRETWVAGLDVAAINVTKTHHTVKPFLLQSCRLILR